MDEAELAQKNQKKFQENLLKEQEDFQQADIEESRARDLAEGLEAQKRLEIEAGILQDNTAMQRERILDLEQQELNAQIVEDQRIQEGQELEANQVIQSEESQSGGTGQESVTSNQQMPSFPLIGFMIAVTKDLFDIILTFTGVGMIIVGLYTVIYDTLAFSWALKRLEKIKAKKDAKSKFKSRLIRRMVSMVAISLVPVLDMLPEASFTVWRNYKAELRLAKGQSV